jgi:hypothetical protein
MEAPPQITRLGENETEGRMNTDESKQQYQGEIELRNAIESSISTPIGVLAGLGSALYLLANTFSYCSCPVGVVFFALACLGYVALGISGYFLVRSAYGYKYLRIPTPKQLREHYEELIRHKESTHKPLEDAKTDFEKYLVEKYELAAESNAKNNIARLKWLHYAKSFLIIVVIVIVLAAPLSLYESLTRTNNPSQAQPCQHVSKEKEKQTMAKDEDKPDLPPPPPPPGPENIVTRDGKNSK